MLSGPARSPRVAQVFAIDLCDPKIPATRQPYHAAMGKLETNAAKLKARLQIVRNATKRSVANVLADCRRKKFKLRGAGLVVGSLVDPASIANPHIRAHALEGELFRTALVSALRATRVRAVVFKERDAYEELAGQLKMSVLKLRRSVENMGHSIAGPWRAEEKYAAIAAWMALTKRNRLHDKHSIGAGN